MPVRAGDQEATTMDPEQALRDAEQHIGDGDLDQAAEALNAYRTWRRGGGFEPADGDRRARELGRRLARARRDRDGAAADSDASDDATCCTIAEAIAAIMADLERRREKHNPPLK
jgi:hypothetical protein